MITNKLNTYIGWTAFVCLWITFILGTVIDIHNLVIVPLLIVFLIIQIIGHWCSDIIYIPYSIFGIKSERLFLESIKEGDMFESSSAVYYVVTTKDQIIGLTTTEGTKHFPQKALVPFLIQSKVTLYNHKPLRFDPLW